MPKPSPLSLLIRGLRRTVGYLCLLMLSLCSLLLKRRVVVIVSPFGNLGNRLFLFANLITFAVEHDAIVLNPAFHPWRSVFAGTRVGLFPCFPALPLPHWPWNLVEHLAQDLAWVCASIASSERSPRQWAYLEINGCDRIDLDHPGFVAWSRSKHVILISGYNYIAEDSMPRHAETIRGYFRQVEGSDCNALAPVTRLRKSCDLVVGVVVRHSGFDKWMNGKYFFNTRVYTDWIRQISSMYPESSVGFMICSDSDLNLVELSGIRHEFRAGSDLENRAALAACDLIIGPPSSYAAWAAVMGNIPLQLLHSSDQVIDVNGFYLIRNHIDLRDECYPPDQNLTVSIISADA